MYELFFLQNKINGVMFSISDILAVWFMVWRAVLLLLLPKTSDCSVLGESCFIIISLSLFLIPPLLCPQLISLFLFLSMIFLLDLQRYLAVASLEPFIQSTAGEVLLASNQAGNEGAVDKTRGLISLAVCYLCSSPVSSHFHLHLFTSHVCLGVFLCNWILLLVTLWSCLFYLSSLL